jgi:hypothetical protein
MLCLYKFNVGHCRKENCLFDHTQKSHEIVRDIFKNYNFYYSLPKEIEVLTSKNKLLEEQLDSLNDLVIKIDKDYNKQIEDKDICIHDLNKRITKIEKQLFQEKAKNIELVEQKKILSDKIEEQHQYILTKLSINEKQTQYYLDLFDQQNKYFIDYCENQDKYYKDQCDDLNIMMETSNMEDKQQLLFLKLENDKLRIIIDDNYQKISNYDIILSYYNTMTISYSILQEKYKKLLNTNENMTEFSILLNNDKKILILKESLTKVDKSYHKNINDIITKFDQINRNLKMLTGYINQMRDIPDKLVKEMIELL